MQHDPLQQFEIWYQDALEAQARGELKMPDAMSLATSSADGKPSSRMLLFKGLLGGGFSFYTNFESRKCRDIFANPNGALLFYWPGLERQVRIEGRIEKLSDAESDRYWNTRPRESNLGAWASQQSAPVADRATLLRQVEAISKQYGNEKPLPRPEFWGGFKLLPAEIEFWMAGEFRLHDRFRYKKSKNGWQQTRLSP